jgi:single-strand DNA-binding protein
MSTRTIIGNLAADPEVVTVGSIRITKMRVIENTGEYRNGTWLPHTAATTHFVEAKFELGENAAATFHQYDPVIVYGEEHTNSWGEEGSKHYGRVIEARSIGVALNHAVAQVRRTRKPDTDD